MNTFPPPQPELEPPAPASSPSRKHLVLAGVAATALGVTGLVVGSQLAGAANEAPDGATEPTAEPVDENDADEIPDTPADDNSTADDSHEDKGDDFINFNDFIDSINFENLVDFDNSVYAEFDACMAEQLSDLFDGATIDIFGDDPLFDEFDLDFGDSAGSVTVHHPGDGGSNFGDVSFLDFGEDDGSITISKSDGQISITTDGDVEQIDAGDLLDLKHLDGAEFEGASEACESTLPELGEE